MLNRKSKIAEEVFPMFALFSSYSSPACQTSNRWHGEAVVDDTIAPNRIGRVRFRATYWNARCDRSLTFLPGEVVEVVGIDNLTLLVRPALH